MKKLMTVLSLLMFGFCCEAQMSKKNFQADSIFVYETSMGVGTTMSARYNFNFLDTSNYSQRMIVLEDVTEINRILNPVMSELLTQQKYGASGEKLHLLIYSSGIKYECLAVFYGDFFSLDNFNTMRRWSVEDLEDIKMLRNLIVN